MEYVATLIDCCDIYHMPWLADAIDTLCDAGAEAEDLEEEPDAECDGDPVAFISAKRPLREHLDYMNDIEDAESQLGGECGYWGQRTEAGWIPDFFYDPGWRSYFLEESRSNLSYQWFKDELFDGNLPQWQLDAIAYEGYEGTLFWPIENRDD